MTFCCGLEPPMGSVYSIAFGPWQGSLTSVTYKEQDLHLLLRAI